MRFEPFVNGVINKETVNRQSTITDNPVEGGGNINDHVFRSPLTFQIAGTVTDGAATIATLQKMWETGDILTYTGRNRIDNLVFQTLPTTHEASNRKGFTFTATLKRVELATSTPSGTAEMMSEMDAAASSGVTSSGGTKAASQTAKTKADGLKTTVSTTISSSAYASYVNSYNSKPASSAGPASRATPANDGRRATNAAY